MAGSAVIKRLGFSVHTAEDGDEAVRMIVEERREFRLVLMDKNMARMDGTEALRKIRQHFTKGVCERSVSVPLLVGCIGDAVREAEEAFLQAGAERVIMKPLQAKDLSALLA
uniref:Response regulatory domain-containing protein n=1 Tax=Chromera velia CCMP2878 TaxID=1169474 RepID=A0A0G4I6B4_9ALVE|eukprot:Cvel_11288.t1-p1 / transcript=Cvel_11288.t1 / gene=Cvel_11288 / organism=Chromera_velia_CCMP2878 / gene_product=Autoinducer 2 sensor kinase/phosphatase LuxQ, putative / transcript_product=Autoinducer 2 sensor kinase/phosphatase LuxQ, putative / location=Cvel_scaffold704:62402-62734(-) / protein_length=111 / sequence_SO=supercontig / SO=protein_coding / is_pseudo=false